MTTKHKSEDYKISAVEYYLNSNKTQEDVCDIFKCSVRSLMRWVERYENEDSIKRHNRKSISYKVKKEHIKFVLEEIKKNKTITIEVLLSKLKDKYKDLELSRRHLADIIKDNYVSLKLTHIRHEPTKRFGKDININEKLKEFYNEIKKYNIKDIISIDETSINSLQKRHHCYNDVGKRCVITTNSQEVFKKYTAIFAINYKGVIGWTLYNKGGIDSDRLYKFLEENITSIYKNKVIILDNASSHRNDKIKKVIEKDNKLLYSIPYQHFTNCIENYFSILKSKLQKLEGLTYNEIKSNITKAINEIPQKTYKNLLIGSYKRDDVYIKKTSRKSSKRFKNYKE
jgi:transposase